MRRVLLDTHVFVWALASSQKLSSRSWDILQNEATELQLSVASAWELAIKSGLGKLSLPGGVRAFVAEGCRAAHVTLLDVRLDHLDQLEGLPLHHRDPFDRMIIAQARAEGIEVLTADPAFAAYDVDLALAF